jgi:5-dehydro-2-deoxygluconokinase
MAGKVGVLIDDRYGVDALNAATGRGWWVGRPVELAGSNPLEFDRGRSVGTTLASWPLEQVVKCLVAYHPDDTPQHRLAQETQLESLFAACQASGHALLLEVIPSANRPHAADTLLRALKRLYNIGVVPEWWKLPPMAAPQWQAVDALIAERDPYCRGVLVLGRNAPASELASAFAATRGSAHVRGFAVGRTLFQEPAAAWLAGRIDDATLVDQAAANFSALIARWRSARGA